MGLSQKGLSFTTYYTVKAKLALGLYKYFSSAFYVQNNLRR
jgi:hypothetical protein